MTQIISFIGRIHVTSLEPRQELVEEPRQEELIEPRQEEPQQEQMEEPL